MKTHFLDRIPPYLLLLLAASFWGGNYNIARAFNDAIPPLGLSFWRWVCASLILLPFVWRPMMKQWPVFLQHWRLVLVLALLGVTSFNSLVYLGLQTTTATNGALMQSLNPVFIIVLSQLLLGEYASRRQWLGVGLSFFGIVVILTRGQLSHLWQLDLHTGDLIILLAVFIWGTYTVLLRKLPSALKGFPVLGYALLIGTLGILPFYLYDHWVLQHPMPVSTASFVSVAYVALFASALAYIGWNHGTAQIGANRAGQFMHVVPISGILIATLVLGEQLQAYHGVGMVLVAMGIILANYSKRLPVRA